MKNNIAELYAGHILSRAAQLWPENSALICQEVTITYAALYKRAQQMSLDLIARGVKKRDRIIILYENSIDFYIAYYGAWQIGAVVVPVNTFLLENELEYIIHDAQPKIIIASSTQREKIVSSVQDIVISVSPDISLHQVVYAPESLEQRELSVLLYTSGTTGLPKGVMLSSHAIITNSIQVAIRFTFVDEQERIYCPLPLFHSFTQNICVWTAPLYGMATILVPKIDRRALREGLTHKPTIVMGIPALYAIFCLLKDADFTYVRYFVCGGDAITDKTRMYFALLYGRNIHNGYGMTETAPVIAAELEDTLQATNVVGKPVVGMACELRNSSGVVLPVSEIGTLWVKGENVMLGYYNAPEATAAVLQDGWLNTGDLATFTQEGKLVICGREKDLIVNNGLKIYPQEVENILMSHMQVTCAAVVGKKVDADEIPIAFITVKQESATLAQEIKKFCAERCAAYKVPRQIIISKELPMTATGKVDKKKLRVVV